MATVTVQLDDLKARAEAQASLAGFDSVGAYLAGFIEEDAATPIGADVEIELFRGLDSGPPVEVTQELWEDLKRRVRQRRQTA